MILTEPGKDIICIDEEDFYLSQKEKNKIHLIKFKFIEPDEKKINWCLNNYPSTNRYIIEDNIKIYNDVLKKTRKKYYIENNTFVGIISFFKKNNKVLLNVLKLKEQEQSFILDPYILSDVLKNIEIIYITQEQFENNKRIFLNWNGNVIIHNKEYLL